MMHNCVILSEVKIGYFRGLLKLSTKPVAFTDATRIAGFGDSINGLDIVGNVDLTSLVGSLEF